jgi:hypothetical protein
MRDYFLFQMIGDFFKVTSYVFGYIAVAKTMTKMYIAAEIVQSLMFILLAKLFIQMAGPIGVTYAYALNYAIYAIIAFTVFRRFIAGSDIDHNDLKMERGTV